MNEQIEIVNPETIEHHRMAGEHRTMNEEEFNSLKLSIENNGQLVPVILYKGKLVDGRHRQKALIELGMHEMKTTSLPGNISLAEVGNKVRSTEMRRTDTPAQKAIRAYMHYRENKGKYTQEEVAIEYGVTRTNLSFAKKIENMIGLDGLKKFYRLGYVYIGTGLNKKQYTNLQTVIRALKTTAEETPQPDTQITESLSSVFSHMSDMVKTEDLTSLAMIVKRANGYINNLTK